MGSVAGAVDLQMPATVNATVALVPTAAEAACLVAVAGVATVGQKSEAQSMTVVITLQLSSPRAVHAASWTGVTETSPSRLARVRGPERLQLLEMGPGAIGTALQRVEDAGAAVVAPVRIVEQIERVDDGAASSRDQRRAA